MFKKSKYSPLTRDIGTDTKLEDINNQLHLSWDEHVKVFENRDVRLRTTKFDNAHLGNCAKCEVM